MSTASLIFPHRMYLIFLHHTKCGNFYLFSFTQCISVSSAGQGVMNKIRSDLDVPLATWGQT